MSGIQRYEVFVAAAYGGPYAAAKPAEMGGYVLHSDHEAEVARLRAELQNAAKAALDAVALSCEKEREADALRAGIAKALDELDDDGPKAVKYAAQELRAAIGASA